MRRSGEPPSPAIWSSKPPAENGYGYLYVLRFDSGAVKVGKTTDPGGRMAGHLSEAGAYGVHLTGAWFSEPHLGYADLETAAIAAVAGIKPGRRARREYFHGVGFQEAVAVVDQVCRGASGRVDSTDVTNWEAEPSRRRPAARAEQLLTLEEAAERLAVTPRTLRRRCTQREITFVATRPPSFRQADLDSYIESLLTPAQVPGQFDPVAEIAAKRAQQAKNLRRRRPR